MEDLSGLILVPGDRTPEDIATTLYASMSDADIPTHLREGLIRYFRDQIRPGGFLEAVLKNNLREAVMRATTDYSVLGRLVLWLNNAVPAPSWGSPQAVEWWLTREREP